MRNTTILFLVTWILSCGIPLDEGSDGGPNDGHAEICNYIPSRERSLPCITRCSDEKTLIECNRNGEEVVLQCQRNFRCCNESCVLIPGRDAGYEAGSYDTPLIEEHAYMVSGGTIHYELSGEVGDYSSVSGDTIEGAYRIQSRGSMLSFSGFDQDNTRNLFFDIQPTVVFGQRNYAYVSILHNGVSFHSDGYSVEVNLISFAPTNNLWVATGEFAGGAIQLDCCSPSYNESVLVSNGLFEILFEQLY